MRQYVSKSIGLLSLTANSLRSPLSRFLNSMGEAIFGPLGDWWPAVILSPEERLLFSLATTSKISLSDSAAITTGNSFMNQRLLCSSSWQLECVCCAFLLLLAVTTEVAAQEIASAPSEKNVPYVEGGHSRQVLDLYLPDQPSEKPWPVVIWIHGGAWMGGSRVNPPIMALLQKGIAVASIDYRFSQDAIWPAQSYDCKAAVRFLRAHADKYHLDADRFGVGGDSAGGHLAAFVGTSGDVATMEGDLGNTNVSSQVQAVLDWFGPTDLLVMGEQAGPNSFIKHDDPNSPESRLMGARFKKRAS
jgi:acetyl esterase/lipase